ncbi:5 -3 exoribonuclease 1, partial [Micractinium conductrix]
MHTLAGSRAGPAMMPGGDAEAYKFLQPIVEKVAAQTDDGACVTYIGKGGSGNFVKMVHNGIEYGDMQLIAEAYDVLRVVGGLSNEELAQVFDEWNKSELESFLVEITASIFKKKDEMGEGFLIDKVQDKTGMKGTGKWTIQQAAELSVAAPTMEAALDARFLSGLKDERVAAEAVYASVGVQPPAAGAAAVDKQQLIADVRAALYASKVCSYAQGYNIIRSKSQEQAWDIDLGSLARIWKGGCIIRAGFLDRIKQAYLRDPALPNLLVDPDFAKDLGERQAAWRRVVQLAVGAGIAVPGITSSLSYFDTYRRGRLPANLVQAQRDFFGSHTYERTDGKEGWFHTGIPKFYRWLSERYPLVNQPGGATVVPIIDNLYLDMNGIIHNCTHGNNPEVTLSEDEMIMKIFTYLDKLFHIVKPQKLLFMAIDGSAPRAKMNQQRARRFKSAFMGRLAAHIRFFVRKKIAEDPAWQKPTIIFSGHDVPGEGEHKIMEYIRWQKRRPNYQPNTRHCLYGLDADLIMLSLVTHEPHFCLLREVVSFTGGGRGQPAREVLDNPCQEHFVLLQIGLLRDYFDAEFKPALAGRLPFAYDLERIVDDFVLFCMLVGNDFLPPLPTVDINEGSLDAMFALYKQMLPALGGYLTHAGELSRTRLEAFMAALAEAEADVLQARAEDAESFESKRSRKRGGDEPAWASARVDAKRSAQEQARLQSEIDEDDAFALDMAKLALQAEGDELELLAAVEGEGEEDGEEGALPKHAITSEPTMMSQEARNLFLNGDKDSGLAAWKRRYYREKMQVSGEAARRAVVESYIQWAALLPGTDCDVAGLVLGRCVCRLHWVLEYYYRGGLLELVLPLPLRPMASDLVRLPEINVSFSL